MMADIEFQYGTLLLYSILPDVGSSSSSGAGERRRRANRDLEIREGNGDIILI